MVITADLERKQCLTPNSRRPSEHISNNVHGIKVLTSTKCFQQSHSTTLLLSTDNITMPPCTETDAPFLRTERNKKHTPLPRYDSAHFMQIKPSYNRNT